MALPRSSAATPSPRCSAPTTSAPHANPWAKPTIVADQTAQYLEWVGLLKSCTVFEAYCRVDTADVTPDLITEFLLLDPVFPHSVRFSIDGVQDALAAITEATGRRANECETGWPAVCRRPSSTAISTRSWPTACHLT